MTQTQRDPEGPADGLIPLAASRRILVVVGSGGVGKTTTAAALGLLAARLGRKTLVMTIDPARRLATSLGLESLDHEHRPIPDAKLAAAGLPPGCLHAMMLDQKQAIDEMVRRYAPDEQTTTRLMASRIYQQLSSRLAGSQEYAAMEKLHAVDQEGIYSLLVLDTPPTANALDFLEAPHKMVDAVESPAVRLFINAYRKSGRLSLGALGLGAAYVVRRLARFTGGEFLDDVAGFLTELSGLLGGMHDRAARVLELLSESDVGFIIVTGPDPRAIDEAIGLHERLIRSEMSPCGFVINKVHPLRRVAVKPDELGPRIARIAGSDLAEATHLAALLLQANAQMQVLARADADQVARLKERCGNGQPYIQVPLFDADIHDIEQLVKVADHLG
jgi:anion-transporting  ArsA/GET3 family ATPase